MTSTTQALPLLERVSVCGAQRLSPSFVRVELVSPALAQLGVDGPYFDQRIKLIFPSEAGALPPMEPGPQWYQEWAGLPAEQRGHMRTYSVRDVLGSGADTRLVVDFTVHPRDAGPGSAWAEHAGPGDEIGLIAPRRGVPFGGIEFDPGGPGEHHLLVADETALPALARILADLPDQAQGTAYVEVPLSADVQELPEHPGVQVRWLPRDSAGYGERLVPHVRAHVGLPATAGVTPEADATPLVWETPSYSASGEDVPDCAPAPSGLRAWIAGESDVVRTLRRALVREAGLDRSAVSFMGYWRRGVAMRS